MGSAYGKLASLSCLSCLLYVVWATPGVPKASVVLFSQCEDKIWPPLYYNNGIGKVNFFRRQIWPPLYYNNGIGRSNFLEDK